jgi:hypothetical protein
MQGVSQQIKPLIVAGVQFRPGTVPLLEPITLLPKPLSERSAHELALAAYLGAIFDVKGYVVNDSKPSLRSYDRPLPQYYLMLSMAHYDTLQYVRMLVGDIGYEQELANQYRLRIRNTDEIQKVISVILPFVVSRREVLLATASLGAKLSAYKVELAKYRGSIQDRNAQSGGYLEAMWQEMRVLEGQLTTFKRTGGKGPTHMKG